MTREDLEAIRMAVRLVVRAEIRAELARALRSGRLSAAGDGAPEGDDQCDEKESESMDPMSTDDGGESPYAATVRNAILAIQRESRLRRASQKPKSRRRAGST